MPYPTKKLGEICNFQNGFAFKSSKFKTNGKAILRISNIQDDNISYDKLVFFDPVDYDKDLSKYIVKKGDLVIAMSGATTGKLAISNTDDEFYLNQRVGKFVFDNEITKIYSYYFLSTKIQENLSKSAGSAIPNLSTKQIKNIPIPLPPLPTQKLIVAKLDELFANLDKQIELTKKQIENIEELNKSVLEEVFSKGEWEEIELGKVVEFGPKKSEVKNLEDLEVSFVPMKYVNEKEKYFKSPEIKKLKEVYKGYTYFKNDDVLLAKVTPCFENGKSGIARDLQNGIGFGSSEFYVFRVGNRILKEYLYYLFISEILF